MQKRFPGLAALLICAVVPALSQNVGINTTTPQGALDINGDLIIRPASLTVADGTTIALDVNTARFGYYRLTGPTADFTIAGITAGVDGRLITLFNYSGFTMQLNNEDAGAAAVDRIVTGTGSDLTISNKGMVSLQYDNAEQKWIVKSSSKGSTGNGGYWDLNGNDIYNTNTGNVGIGTNVPTSILTLQTPVNTTGWTHIGGANEVIVNEAIGGVSASLGTMTNHAFRLKANGVGGIHLYPGGKAVVGSNGFATTSFGRLFVESDLGYGITHSDGTISVGTYVGGFPQTGWFGTISNHPLSFFANNGGALMTILQNGYVGIGTNAPGARLHVAGHQKIDGNNVLEFGAGIPKEGSAGKIGYQTFTADALDIVGAGTVQANRKIKFWNEGNALFAGAVGIATANTGGYMLAVNGNIRSKEVVVENGWADYVFEKKYQLPLLSDVEKFILENKHLPNIPSAAEIEKNGLHLGDIQKRMMEKIEELTLYIIQQQKEINELKKVLPKAN